MYHFRSRHEDVEQYDEKEIQKKCFRIGCYCLFSCALGWVLLIPYFADINEFNLIQNIIDSFFAKLQEHLEETIQNMDGSKNVTKYVHELKGHVPLTMKIIMVSTLVYALSCILMMVGTMSEKTRFLMRPYLVVQLALNIALITNNIFMTSTALYVLHYPVWVLLLFIIMSVILPLIFVK